MSPVSSMWDPRKSPPRLNEARDEKVVVTSWMIDWEIETVGPLDTEKGS
jgi:hypothetical protein